MAVAVDLGQRARLADEGIARCGLTFRRDVDHLAEIRVQLLRHQPGRRFGAVAHRHEQIAVMAYGDAAAGIGGQRIGKRRPGPEDDAHIAERVTCQIRPRQGDVEFVRAHRFGVAEIEPMIAGEFGIERDIQKTHLTLAQNRRHAGDRLR